MPRPWPPTSKPAGRPADRPEFTSFSNIAVTGPSPSPSPSSPRGYRSTTTCAAGSAARSPMWRAELAEVREPDQSHRNRSFVFQEWVPNDHFTATKNHHYWRPGLPTSTASPTSPSRPRLAAADLPVRWGRHHAHDTANAIKTLRSDTSYGYIDDTQKVAGEPDMGCLLLNLSKAPFDNLKVRQATAYASARPVRGGDRLQRQPHHQRAVHLHVPYYNPTALPKYDPAKATQLVSEVHSETGQPVVVTSTTFRIRAPRGSPSTCRASSSRSG